MENQQQQLSTSGLLGLSILVGVGLGIGMTAVTIVLQMVVMFAQYLGR